MKLDLQKPAALVGYQFIICTLTTKATDGSKQFQFEQVGSVLIALPTLFNTYTQSHFDQSTESPLKKTLVDPLWRREAKVIILK